MVNTTLANSLLRRLHTQYVQHNIQYLQQKKKKKKKKYINEKKISRVQNIKLMINNIILHDHRFDIRHCAQNPQLHLGPFHNLIRFLNAVNPSHCLISLPSEFHKTGDKYDRLFFP